MLDAHSRGPTYMSETMIRPRRSALYVPGSNPRALEKARTLEADVLMFDFEDGVAPDHKVEARQQVIAALKAGGEALVSSAVPGSKALSAVSRYSRAAYGYRSGGATAKAVRQGAEGTPCP